MLVLEDDGEALSDVWDDDVVCVVGARADRSVVAGESGGVPARPAFCSARRSG